MSDRQREVQVTFDCADPRALVGFWCEVLGYGSRPHRPGSTPGTRSRRETLPEHLRNIASACEDPDGDGPRLFFQQVPEGKTVKNRVHLDVRAAPGLEGEERMAALEAECERLVGARRDPASSGSSRRRR